MSRRSSSERQAAREKYFIAPSSGWHAREDTAEAEQAAYTASADLAPVVYEGAEDVPEIQAELESLATEIEYAPEFADFGDLAESLTDVEEEIGEIVADVEQKISDAEVAISEIEAEIEETEYQADAGITDREAAEEHLDHLYSRLHEIEGEIEEYPEDFDELTAEFDAIRSELSDLKSEHLDVTESNVEELLETMTAQEILDAWGIPTDYPEGAIYRGETPFLDDVLQFFVDIGGNLSELFSYTATEGGYAIWELAT